MYPTDIPLGHVFHGHCMEEWFETETRQALRAGEEHGEAEDDIYVQHVCPICRCELGQDEEGEPVLETLYFTFDENDDDDDVEIVSAPKSRQEMEVLAYVGRSRRLGKEVAALNGNSSEEEGKAAVKHAQGLFNDMLSAETTKVFKVCQIGGTRLLPSTSANTSKDEVNTLKTKFETLQKAWVDNPFNWQIKQQLVKCQEERDKAKKQRDQYRRSLDENRDRNLEKIAAAERAVLDQAQADRNRAAQEMAILRETLVKEQAAHRAAKSTHDQAIRASTKEVAELNK